MPLDGFGNYITGLDSFATTGLPPAVSYDWELSFRDVVSGHGAPTHTPIVAAQQYRDVDSGRMWQWSNNSWE